ncbi:MAG: efflux RND transporter permease subunit, partial [Myxococcales bacterium]|nr:efflux RND transporter permease subunit [Myxococcales bacterium]
MIHRIICLSVRHKYLVVMVGGILCVWAWIALKRIPLDALPDLSDTQVIIYSRWERSPNVIEDQVTYPIITSLLGTPRVKAIRGYSDFGYSFVYVLFEDGTDIYWARTRVLESLSKIQARLPSDVRIEMGPDASGVGWVFQYALVDESGRHSLDELRSYQDWFLRYALQSVAGVAEVASLGGAVKQYQVTVDPNRLAALRLSLAEVGEAIRRSNGEVGGRLLELSGKEFMVRGRGYLGSAADIEQVVVRTNEAGTPLRVRDIGRVSLGPDIRRGLADLDGKGDVVGGIVIMRQGERALDVIGRIKDKLREIAPSLPDGVRIVTTYDRADLIERAIATLRDKLTEEMIIVSLVILLFLWHVPSAVVPIVTIPVAVLLSFIPMLFLGVHANIMSLSGIAISIGVLVDGAIVEVENAYKRLQLWLDAGRPGDVQAVRLAAMQEVGPPVFFSLLVVAVAFLPVFTLVEQEGRLFRPLAISKNLAMAIAAVLAITLDPALRMMFTRVDPFCFRPAPLCWLANRLLVGRYQPEERHPISRALFRVYEPACRLVLRHPRATLLAALLVVLTAVPVYFRLGSEFMPPLQEGSLLYMPTTLPGISATEAFRLLQIQDRILRSFPEVHSVFGKAGRADTSTDPAPLSMMETTVVLRPESQWRVRPRWYSGWAPSWLQALLRPLWRDRISYEELVAEMDRALRLPGVTNAWTMPIKARIDMLSTGVRTPVGIKIFGSDLAELERIGVQLEAILREVPHTRSVFAERAAGGYFIDFDLRRDALARYGLTVQDANQVILSALGGEAVTTTIEGRERYTVNLRYPRELRQDLTQLRRVLVPTPGGAQVPLEQLAEVRLSTGPAMIRNENGLLSAYVYIDPDTSARDIGRYIEDARQAVRERLRLRPGYTLVWSGQYESMVRVRERLKLVLPLTVLIIFLLLYLNTGST